VSKDAIIISVEQLLKELSDTALFSQMIVQLQKDINRSGIDYQINMNNDPRELFLEVEQLVLENINNRFNDFLNLLYAVDVSEKDIRKSTSEKSAVLASYAAFLILKREWQKVCYRNML